MKTKKLLLALLLCLASVAFVACGKDAPQAPSAGKEQGVYYYEDEVGEHTLELDGFGKFVLYTDSSKKTGTYAISDTTITLSAQGSTAVEGRIDGQSLIIPDDDGLLQIFVRRLSYTVTFESNGGSSVVSQMVINGKIVRRPADPTRNGYTFVAWYADSEFKQPFAFNSTPVTADMTLYAKWIEVVPGQTEYLVSFDAGEGVADIGPMRTISGKLPIVPTVQKDGYVFKGWWVSQTNSADALSYLFSEDYVFDADTTLFAVWVPQNTGSVLSEPIVRVNADGLSWDTDVSAASYHVVVNGPQGFPSVDVSITTGVYAIDFASAPAGRYDISVVAVASAAENNSPEVKRVYLNKALARVSQFAVYGNSVLSFGAVPNATNYYVTVDCGNKNHVHTRFNNRNFTTYNFANCDMQPGGIKFSVEAQGDGYYRSVSDVFVYENNLAPVQGLALDGDGRAVRWYPVQNAAIYAVKIGNNIYHTAQTSFALDMLDTGDYEISVTPITDMYNSPAPATISYNKAQPAAPQDITVRMSVDIDRWGDVTDSTTYLGWDWREGASVYELKINGTTFEVEAASAGSDHKVAISLKEKKYADVLDASGVDAVNTVQIRYQKDGVWSDWSESCGIVSRLFSEDLYYHDGYLHWRHVMTAVKYEIVLNHDFNEKPTPDATAITTVETGANKARVALTQSGVNVISVRVSDGEAYSNWVHVSVVANAVTLDSRGSSDVANQTVYLEYGDTMNLPVPQKDGYVFEGWYSTPGGAEGNGKKFTDTIYHHSGELTLYAYYTPRVYEVTLDLSAAAAGTPEKVNVNYGQNYTLPVPAPFDATKAFKGWYKGSTRLTNEEGIGIGKWSYDESEYINGELKLTAGWYDDVLQFTEYSAAMGGYGVYKGSGIDEIENLVIPRLHKGQPIVMITAAGFESCESLKSITFYDTLQNVQTPQDTFNYCYELEAINVIHVEGNRTARLWSQDGVLFDRGNMDDYTQGSLGSLIFVPRKKGGEFTVPEGVHTIGNRAFYYTVITGVIIPASVTRIEDEAFYNCRNLSKVVFRAPAFGQKVEELKFGNGPFKYCSSLTNINLPARLGEMDVQKAIVKESSYSGKYLTSNYDKMAFYGCSNLSNITVDDGNKYYSSSADGMLLSADGRTILYVSENFDFTKADGYDADTGTYTVPRGQNGISAIGQGAFYGCSKLTKLVIPTYITKIGIGAFGGYGGLQKVVFAGERFGALILDDFAFSGASKLTEVVFESGCNVTEIGMQCFKNCSKLRTISVPNTVTKVGAGAFSECRALATATFTDANADQVNAGLTLEFGLDAFSNTAITSFYVTNVVTKLPSIFSGCTRLTSVTVSEGNENFKSENNALYTKDGKEIIFYLSSNLTANLDLPKTLETIGNGVFRGNSNLKTVTIPASVKTIGEYAFADCSSLTGVTFEEPQSDAEKVELEIGDYAFQNCTALKSFTVPGRTAKLGSSIFVSSGVETLTIAEGVTKIGQEAFSGMSELRDLAIAASVTEIEAEAFRNYSAQTQMNSLTFGENSKLEKIGQEAFAYFWIDTVTLPDSLTEIGVMAFTNARISTLDLSGNSKLTKIRSGAFYGCEYLTSVSLPTSLTHLGPMVFYECPVLESVTFDVPTGTRAASEEPEDLYIGDVDTYIAYSSNYTEIGGTFMDCVNLKSIALPDRTVYIGPFTFQNCIALETVEIGTTTTTGANTVYNSRLAQIGESAFNGCKKISSIALPGTLSFAGVDGKPKGGTTFNGNITYTRGTTYHPGIGDKAFAGCSNLTTFTIAAPAAGATNLFAIGAEAFSDCEKLAQIVLPANLAEYSVSGYTADGLKGGYEVFLGCDALAEIVLTNPVDGQGAAQFTNCGYDDIAGILTNKERTTILYCPPAYAVAVTIPSSVTLIEENAFAYCENVPSVTFEGEKTALAADGSNGLVIGASAFDGCTTITAVVLPDRTVTIGNAAFANCTALTTITIPQQLVSFSPSIYSGSPNVKLLVSGSNTELKVVGDALYNKDETTLYAFIGNSTVTTFTVPDTVTTIASGAFADKTALTSVNLSKVKTIESGAFSGSGLTKVVIPETVTFIGDRAFYKCAKLDEITFENGDTTVLAADKSNGLTIGGDVGEVFARTAITSISFPKRLANIGSSAFVKMKLTSVTIPGSIGSIDTSAFAKNKLLTSVTIKNGIRTIEANAFADCPLLETVTFEEGVLKTIGDGAFKNTALKAVVIPNTVTSIGANAFADCASLGSISLSATLETIGAGAFAGCTSLTSITIPATVKTIGSYAGAATDGVFSGCTSLAAVTFASGSVLEAIDAYAFYKCALSGNNGAFTLPDEKLKNIGAYAFAGSGIKSITIPSCVTTLGAHIFEECALLTTVSIPATVTTLSDYAFSGCKQLNSVTLASGLTTIGQYAFNGCVALTGISLPDTVTSIGVYAFAYSGLTSFTVPAKVTMLSNYLFYYCANLQTITFTSSALKSIGDSNSYSSSYTFAYCTMLTELELPDSIENIGSSSFEGCSALQSITLPKTIKAIESSTFKNCTDLQSLSIPDSVTEINAYAFQGCTSLKWVKLPDNVDFTTLNYGTFDGCTSLVWIGIETDHAEGAQAVMPSSITTLSGTAIFRNTGFVNIKLSDSITSIPNTTFLGCKNLETIVLPASLTSILVDAFKDCASLTTVTLPAELNEFGVSNVGSQNEPTNNPFNGCTDLTEFVTTGNGAFVAVDGVLYNADKTTLIAYPAAKASGEDSLAIESTVKKVRAGAFYGVEYAKARDAVDNLPASAEIDRMAGYLFSGVVGDATSGQKVLDLSGTGWTEIPEYQFAGGDFESVILPTGLKKIGNNAFQGTKIKSITIPNTVTYIGGYAFQGTPLTSITIPASVTYIGGYVFQNCTDLATVTFEKGGTKPLIIGNNVFQATAITSIEIPYRVMGQKPKDDYSSDFTMGYSVFEDCTNLSVVTFEDKVAGVESGIDGVKVEDMVIYVGSRMFDNTAIKNIILPERWYNISYNMFSGCVNLESIVLPKNIFEIDSGVFSNCKKFTTIYYQGQKQDWNKIIRSTSSNEVLDKAKVLFYHDGHVYETGMWRFVATPNPADGDDVDLKISTKLTTTGEWITDAGDEPQHTADGKFEPGRAHITCTCNGTPHDVYRVTQASHILHDGVCSVCHKALLHEAVNDEVYPFRTTRGGKLTSTNKQHSTTSSYTITVLANVEVSFTYKVSSEENWDKFHVYVNGVLVATYSGEASGSYSVELAAGDTLRLEYAKDSSGSKGTDQVIIDNLLVEVA